MGEGTGHLLERVLEAWELGRKRERESEREDRKKEGRKKGRKGGREGGRKTDMWTQALMEQRCFNQHGLGMYTVLQGGYSQQRQRLKFQTYKA